MGTEVLGETLHERRRQLAWWAAGLVALIAVTIAFYPSIRDDQALSEYAKDMPESLRALFVGGELDLASPTGYLNSQIFALTAPLILLVFAIGAGAGLVAGEEERGTLDLLLAQPLRRRDYVLQRIAALVVLVAGLSAVVLATVAVGARLVDLDIAFGRLVEAMASVFLLVLLFGVLALAVGAFRPGRAEAIAVAAGLALFAWIVDGLAQVVDVLEPVRPLSPYYQTLGQNPLRDGISWTGSLLVCGAIACLVLAASVGLERRDLRQ